MPCMFKFSINVGPGLPLLDTIGLEEEPKAGNLSAEECTDAEGVCRFGSLCSEFGKH